ncbi:hypothetical protein P4H82_27985 [Bacillus cereus]|nr:hypothetical protein [Bacillus cereus]MEB9190639.1 hypothetical protein [Bacillus cereus]
MQNKTTLTDKQEYALSRGYKLLAHENPKLNQTVYVERLSDGVEFMCNWKRFTEGTVPKKTTLRGKTTQIDIEGYELVDQTENFTVRDKIKLKSKETGIEFSMLYQDFLQGKRERASYSKSKGEAIILSFIKENLLSNYTYDYQYCISLGEDKKGIFDFAIFNENKEIVALIEYNGRQHYEIVDFFGEESCLHTQQNDKLKRKYCQDNQLQLIVIPYTIKGKDEIVGKLREVVPCLFEEELIDFTVVRGDKYATTLEQKKEQARSVGWELLEEKNFKTVEQVKLFTGKEEITMAWTYFLMAYVNKTWGTKTKEGLN